MNNLTVDPITNSVQIVNLSDKDLHRYTPPYWILGPLLVVLFAAIALMYTFNTSTTSTNPDTNIPGVNQGLELTEDEAAREALASLLDEGTNIVAARVHDIAPDDSGEEVIANVQIEDTVNAQDTVQQNLVISNFPLALNVREAGSDYFVDEIGSNLEENWVVETLTTLPNNSQLQDEEFVDGFALTTKTPLEATGKLYTLTVVWHETAEAHVLELVAQAK